MARGTVIGEGIVSQASTDEFRDSYARTFGDRPVVRGRWVYDVRRKGLVPADEYVPPSRALDAPIIADRIHEGTKFHDGERVRDLGSRAKRRAFLRETGLAEASDYSASYRGAATQQRERAADHRIDRCADEAARKLYHQGKMRD
jgi:hypothetical protein